MNKILLSLSAVILLCTCQSVPQPASPAYNISSNVDQPARRPASECTFRYRIANSFDRLDNQIQQQAVRSAFDLWQQADPNITFIQRQNTEITEISIEFAAHQDIDKSSQQSSIGLIPGVLPTMSSSKELDGVYKILLDSEFLWDALSITRVIAYHIGIFAGLPVSSDQNSILNPVYLRQSVQLSDRDIEQINKLYPRPCSQECATFMPLQLSLRDPITKSIRLDRQGTISIKASGSMIVGFWLGWSTPAGLEKGLFSFPIGDYSVDRSFNHAALLYKINQENQWHLCGSACEFQTDGVSQCFELTLGINDNDLSDNNGAYNVSVDYK